MSFQTPIKKGQIESRNQQRTSFESWRREPVQVSRHFVLDVVRNGKKKFRPGPELGCRFEYAWLA